MPPSKGPMSLVPPKILPYAEMIRLDKPGFVYFFIPHVFGALLAGLIQRVLAEEFSRILSLLLAATILLTFVNYAWNDLVDAEFDSKVFRARHRPIARGAISKAAAFSFTVLLAVITAAFLLTLRRARSIYALPMSVGAFIYPLSKRFTHYPQVIFGFVIASEVFMGAAAFGVTPFTSHSSSTASPTSPLSQQH